MKFTNIEMDQKITDLEPFLERTDVIGYSAARNTRMLLNQAVEYREFKDILIDKYGEPEVDENGNPTGRKFLRVGTEAFEKFKEEINQIASMEYEVDGLITLKYSDVNGILSGTEILTIDWMLED